MQRPQDRFPVVLLCLFVVVDRVMNFVGLPAAAAPMIDAQTGTSRQRSRKAQHPAPSLHEPWIKPLYIEPVNREQRADSNRRLAQTVLAHGDARLPREKVRRHRAKTPNLP